MQQIQMMAVLFIPDTYHAKRKPPSKMPWALIAALPLESP
jgi:hypothetical protein